jgi:hypothetical protein
MTRQNKEKEGWADSANFAPKIEVIHEAPLNVQAGCAHSRCGWAVQEIATTDSRAKGPIRWTCLDCGTRTIDGKTNPAQPYAEHPDHARYPRVIPNFQRSREDPTLPLF